VILTLTVTGDDEADIIIDRLAVDPNDRELMLNEDNDGNFVRFLASQYSGIAYVDHCYVGAAGGSARPSGSPTTSTPKTNSRSSRLRSMTSCHRPDTLPAGASAPAHA